MRLNLSGRDLGYMFGGISEATVSHTFLHVVNVLYHRLKPLVIWPERDALRSLSFSLVSVYLFCHLHALHIIQNKIRQGDTKKAVLIDMCLP